MDPNDFLMGQEDIPIGIFGTDDTLLHFWNEEIIWITDTITPPTTILGFLGCP